MSDRHNELELLALIEGELDAQATAALRKRLAGDEATRALVERMGADRASLRALPQPELPMDFLRAIEPMLARPMLMDPVEANGAVIAAKPGAFRREYRKRTRRVRWDRLAIAAVLMLALMAGIWAAVNGFSGRATQSNEMAANNDGAGVDTVANLDQPDRSAEPSVVAADDGTVHHYRPMPVAMDLNKPRLADAGNPAPPNGRAAVIAATFALVMNTADPAKTEQTVQVAASDLGERGSLVRNFSFDEAQKLAEEWRLANAGSAGPGDPRVASAGSATSLQWKTPAEMKVLAERVRQRLKMLKTSVNQPEAAPIERSGQLTGSKELAPTLEQQLDFSSRGASYTLAVPVSQINALIERLGLADGQSTALRMLPEHEGLPQANTPRSATDAWQPLLLWLTDGPKVRQEIDRISKEQPDAIVLVPIVVAHAHKG